MRPLLTAALALSLGSILLAQDPDDKKPIKEKQLRAEAELIDQLRKKDQEHYAKKLEEGRSKLHQDRVSVNIRAVVEHLDANQIEKALAAGEGVAKALDRKRVA